MMGGLGIALCTLPAMAEQASGASGKRPVTALVLGGGGARGAAHIGVLQVLEQERIPVDCVVGTSMGALVAGAYAAGLAPSEMLDKLAEADWTDMFLDTADYSQLSYRKKRVNKGLLLGTEMGITKRGVQIMPGVIAGEKIKLFFNFLVSDEQGQHQIENLSLPLAIVATDIGTGERVVIRKGSLTHAMRASMSVPGLMAPVEYEGGQLVDGGLVDNLPIGIGRGLCNADRVIAINVGSPLRPADEVGSLLSVTGQMIGILTKQNVERSLATLTGNDIYMAPELGNIKSTDFKRYAEAAEAGRQTALRYLYALKDLSVSPEAYAQWNVQRRVEREPIVRIDEIHIAPLNRVNSDFVERLVRQRPGENVDRRRLEQDLIRIYGAGYFDSVDYRIYQHDGVNRLDILAREKNWSSDYVTFGFTVAEEYRHGASVNLRGAYRNTWINSYGGEFFAVLDAGTDPYVELDFYQPLDTRHKYFVEPRYISNRQTSNIFIDGDKIAEYELTTHSVELMLGRNVGIWGQVRSGWREYDIKASADISLLNLPDANERYGGWLTEVLFDARNRLYFPSQGWSGDLGYFASPQADYEKLFTRLDYAHPLGDFVLGARGSFVTSINDPLPVYDSAQLGGFLNLSGYARNQILADQALYLHLRAEKIVGRMPLGLSGDLRMGLALEGAKLEDAYTLTKDDDWLNSAAIYWGGETPVGPVYIGYGFTFSGDYNFYFQIGP
ncbi:BamA/TamA family outer membrane protein [Cellvibrio japonicus]|nr:BamA/TamA family outer membrane protein [Cellvibrio japonicus]QEI17722.1 BamA/TamA family outer membrane protein [Cellvibrio japonicus]QEI21297.1 BamA/TamA family outer membrane protein [Cellvibrio japonicus]